MDVRRAETADAFQRRCQNSELKKINHQDSKTPKSKFVTWCLGDLVVTFSVPTFDTHSLALNGRDDSTFFDGPCPYCDGASNRSG